MFFLHLGVILDHHFRGSVCFSSAPCHLSPGVWWQRFATSPCNGWLMRLWAASWRHWEICRPPLWSVHSHPWMSASPKSSCLSCLLCCVEANLLVASSGWKGWHQAKDVAGTGYLPVFPAVRMVLTMGALIPLSQGIISLLSPWLSLFLCSNLFHGDAPHPCFSFAFFSNFPRLWVWEAH